MALKPEIDDSWGVGVHVRVHECVCGLQLIICILRCAFMCVRCVCFQQMCVNR